MVVSSGMVSSDTCVKGKIQKLCFVFETDMYFCILLLLAFGTKRTILNSKSTLAQSETMSFLGEV